MKRNFFTIFFVLLTMGLSGCLPATQKKPESRPDGGLFVSVDNGETWQQKSLILSLDGNPRSFANADGVSLALDPNDPDAVYFGSVNLGLLYSYDSGKSWLPAKKLGKGTVLSIAVDPINKCTVYAAVANKLYKTEDCARNWQQVYFDDMLKVRVNSIAIDHYNSQIIYIGVSRGDIIKSKDGGKDWQTVKRLNGAVTKILIDPSDSRTIYALLAKPGLWRSTDAGKTWENIYNNLKQIKKKAVIRDIGLTKQNPALIIAATAQGMVRSFDRGKTWEKMNLIPPEKNSRINAIVIDQNNAKNIYYITNHTFFRTIDGGDTWRPIKLPSTRAGQVLLLGYGEKPSLYLTVKTIKKK